MLPPAFALLAGLIAARSRKEKEKEGRKEVHYAWESGDGRSASLRAVTKLSASIQDCDTARRKYDLQGCDLGGNRTEQCLWWQGGYLCCCVAEGVKSNHRHCSVDTTTCSVDTTASPLQYVLYHAFVLQKAPPRTSHELITSSNTLRSILSEFLTNVDSQHTTWCCKQLGLDTCNMGPIVCRHKNTL